MVIMFFLYIYKFQRVLEFLYTRRCQTWRPDIVFQMTRLIFFYIIRRLDHLGNPRTMPLQHWCENKTKALSGNGVSLFTFTSPLNTDNVIVESKLYLMLIRIVNNTKYMTRFWLSGLVNYIWHHKNWLYRSMICIGRSAKLTRIYILCIHKYSSAMQCYTAARKL